MSADQHKPSSPLGLKKAVIFALVPVLFLLLAGYFAHGVYRSWKMYDFLKSRKSGWEGKPFQYDPILGFAPVKPGSAVHISNGETVLVKFDGRGFRVPADQPADAALKRPLVLSLGCSYTFGDGVAAEKTFTWLVAKELDGTALNAGVPAYGLVQMLALAQRLIPQYQPDYLLVQYSSWLLDRSLIPFAISYTGLTPAPYFTKGADNMVRPAPPPFRAKVFDLPLERYQGSPKSALDFARFFREVGCPLLAHDDLNLLWLQIKYRAGQVPRPLNHGERFNLIRPVYENIERLCAQNGAKMVVVILHDPLSEGLKMESWPELASLRNFIIVDSEPALLRPLEKVSLKSYYQRYGRTGGSPPKLLDPHPNELAHEIIAAAVLEALGKPGRGQDSGR